MFAGLKWLNAESANVRADFLSFGRDMDIVLPGNFSVNTIYISVGSNLPEAERARLKSMAKKYDPPDEVMGIHSEVFRFR